MQSQWKDVQKLLAKQLLALQGLLRDYDRRTSATVRLSWHACGTCAWAAPHCTALVRGWLACAQQEELHALLCSGAASGAVSQFLQSTLNATVRNISGAHTPGFVSHPLLQLADTAAASLLRVYVCARVQAGSTAASEVVGWGVQQHRDACRAARSSGRRGDRGAPVAPQGPRLVRPHTGAASLSRENT